MASQHTQAQAVFQAIHGALAADARSREPMNALVLWTELGKGLAGTLERVGAGKGLLREVVDRHCAEKGAAKDCELSGWAYQVEAKQRLGPVAAGVALRRIQEAIENAVPELVAEGTMGDEGRKKLFLTIVRGWFPVGLDIFRALPAGRTAGEAELYGALEAWCLRFFPVDSAAGADLGVRVERGAAQDPGAAEAGPGPHPGEDHDHAHGHDPGHDHHHGHGPGHGGGHHHHHAPDLDPQEQAFIAGARAASHP